MLHRKDRFNKKRIYKNTMSLLFKHSISLLLGQSIFIGLSILLLTPFLSFIYHLALKVTGYSYLTVTNIALFLLNPLVIPMLILLFVVISIFLLSDACYLITFFAFIENGEKPRQFKIFLFTIKKLFLIFLCRDLTLLPKIWLIMGLSNLPLFVFIVKKVRLIKYIAEPLKDNSFMLAITAVMVILLLWIMIRSLFPFLYSLIERKSYVRADKRGRESDNKTGVINGKFMNKINVFRTLFYFIIWNIGIGLLVLALYILITAITILFITGIRDRGLAIATFLTMNDKMNGYLFMGIFAISTIANFALFTHLFFQYKLEFNEDVKLDHTVDHIMVDHIAIRMGAHKNVIKILLIILVLADFYFFFDIMRNGSPLGYMNLDTIRVTSHRGYSYEVPENTLPAVEKAIEELADYVEVDVRLTKDGELVLLHDDNLRRTTGVDKKIWDATYAETASLDAGSWKNKAYTGVKIPTLREVFELCKGKVNLNLDLKYRYASEGLVEKVVALIEEYDMEWQCVISSTSFTALQNVKALNPDIRTGYIAYQIYQGYFKDNNIDFFSVKTNLVTKTLCNEVHKSGKELHVWTVNSKNELERVKRLGVDNVITDDPSYAKEILYQEDSDWFLLTVLKIMVE